MRNILMLLACLLLASACVTKDVDVPWICAADSKTFPAAPPLPAGFHIPPITTSVSLNVSEIGNQIQLLGGNLKREDGESFAILDSIQIFARAVSGDKLMLWDSAASTTDTAEIVIPRNPNSLAAYVSPDMRLNLSVTVSTQTPPETAVVVDFALCFTSHSQERLSI